MIGFSKDKVENPGYIFDNGFGKQGIKEGQTYGGCWMGMLTKEAYNKTLDVRKQVYATLLKDRTTTTDEFASGTTYSSTSGNLPIFPIYVQPDIIDIVRRKTPLYEMLPKKAVRGKFIDFNQRSALPTASFKFENASMSPSDSAYTRKSVEVKCAYAVGKITGLAIAVYNGFMNIMNEEVMVQTQALVELLESKILSGDSSTNAEEFDGFDSLITTNTIDKSGAQITLEDVRNAIRYAKMGGKTSVTGSGSPNLIVTNYVTYDILKSLIQPFQRWNDTNTLLWGIQTFTIDGINVIVDPFATIASSSKRLYVLDLSTWYLGVLQDITYEELAKVDDSNKFMIKWYGALTCTAEKFNAMVYGIL